MARGAPARVDLAGASLERLVHEMGVRLGRALGSALAAGIGSGAVRTGVPGLGAAEVAPGRTCRVSGCLRRQVAKGLCATHYRKAHRVGLRGPFNAKALAALAADGRKARSAKRR